MDIKSLSLQSFQSLQISRFYISKLLKVTGVAIAAIGAITLLYQMREKIKFWYSRSVVTIYYGMLRFMVNEKLSIYHATELGIRYFLGIGVEQNWESAVAMWGRDDVSGNATYVDPFYFKTLSNGEKILTNIPALPLMYLIYLGGLSEEGYALNRSYKNEIAERSYPATNAFQYMLNNFPLDDIIRIIKASNLKETDRGGDTLLTAAVTIDNSYIRIPAVELLCELGADPHQQNKNGQSALDLADDDSVRSILLRSNGR